MDKIHLADNESTVSTYPKRKKSVLKIVVTDGTTEIARAFVYRILTDNAFGEDQPLFISLYELPDRATFLESVMIELTSFSPNLLNVIRCFDRRNEAFESGGLVVKELTSKLHYYFTAAGIDYGHEAAIQFKEADVAICIGFAREYDFKSEEYTDLFFEEYVRTSKFYGEAIEKYAKREAKIIVLGNTAATIISKYAKSIPTKNITTLSLINLNIAAAQIASRVQCLPTEVKNIIIWGSNGTYSFPDCRYIYFTNGATLSDSLKAWIRDVLPCITRNMSSRPAHIRSIAYALAKHCKILWNGTPKNEWTCMGVLSDHTYAIRSGFFFSFPVVCKNRRYEIVKDLDNDRYIKKYISDLSRLIFREIQQAFKICELTPDE